MGGAGGGIGGSAGTCGDVADYYRGTHHAGAYNHARANYAGTDQPYIGLSR